MDNAGAAGAPSAKRVMVVDDDDDFRGCLEQAIRKEGFDVQTAEDGSTAAILIRERAPDVVLTDLMMTGVGGFELMRNLAEGEFASIPIIVITARPVSRETASQMMNQANVVEIIQKPPNLPMVIEKLHRVLQTQPKTAAAEPKKPADKSKAVVADLRGALASVVAENKFNLDLDVLIVDDSETQRFHIKSVFEDHRCRCREAGDGKNALEALKSYKPDAIILDFTMPQLDGFGLLRVLQGDPNLSEIPILVLTGKIMNDAMRSEIEMEPNVERVFVKPPNVPAMLEILRQIAVEKRKNSL